MAGMFPETNSAAADASMEDTSASIRATAVLTRGPALRSRTGVGQEHEMYLRVFTHDVMVLAGYG